MTQSKQSNPPDCMTCVQTKSHEIKPILYEGVEHIDQITSKVIKHVKFVLDPPKSESNAEFPNEILEQDFRTFAAQNGFHIYIHNAYQYLHDFFEQNPVEIRPYQQTENHKPVLWKHKTGEVWVYNPQPKPRWVVVQH